MEVQPKCIYHVNYSTLNGIITGDGGSEDHGDREDPTIWEEAEVVPFEGQTPPANLFIMDLTRLIRVINQFTWKKMSGMSIPTSLLCLTITITFSAHLASGDKFWMA